MIGRDGSVHDQTWPNFDEDALKREEVEIVIQVNGKVRDRMVLPLDINKVEMEKHAIESEKIKKIIGTKVYIKKKAKNNGKIEIEYYSYDELERIVELFESIK